MEVVFTKDRIQIDKKGKDRCTGEKPKAIPRIMYIRNCRDTADTWPDSSNLDWGKGRMVSP